MEVNALAMEVQCGNNDAFPALWDKVQRLACMIAGRYVPVVQPSDVDDLAQLAALGVWDACKTFNPIRSGFSTWMVYYIKARIRRELLQPRLATVSLDAPLSEDGEGTLLDVTPDKAAADPEEVTERNELAQRVREAVDRLPPSEKLVISMCDLQGFTAEDVARETGETEHNVRRNRKNAFRRLRHDWRLRMIRPDSSYRVGVQRFSSTWTSSTEALAIWRNDT